MARKKKSQRKTFEFPEEVHAAQLQHLAVTHHIAYACSPGGGYHYRGRVASLSIEGCEIVDVETLDGWLDHIPDNPYAVDGPWRPYDDLYFVSHHIDVRRTGANLEIHYRHAGTVIILPYVRKTEPPPPPCPKKVL